MRERIESRNALENYAFGLKSQVGDSNGLGAKIVSDEKKQILDAVKEIQVWLEEYGATATVEDFEERKEMLSAVAHPITSRLYDGGRGEETEEGFGHDEL
jgi:heat shock protein 5